MKRILVKWLNGYWLIVFLFTSCYAQEAENLVAQSLSAGQNVTLDFKDADIRNVLKIISYKSGINIVTTPEVIGEVTIRLLDIPWEKALDTIVKTYGFGYEWLNEKVIMVSTLEKLAQQRKAQAEAQEMEPLDTQTFVLNFSKAEDVKTAIEKLISTRGKLTLENRTNTLIITDTKSNLMKVAEVIKSLDKITPQVMIEAKIIETTLGTVDKLGIDWTLKVTAKGAKRPVTFPFEPRGGERWLDNAAPFSLPTGSGTVGDFPSVGTAPPLSGYPYGFPYGKAGYKDGVLVGDFTFGTLDFTQLQAVLEVLQSRSETRILSNPRVTTLNNQEAKILVGTIVPIPSYQYSKETGTMIISGYTDKEVGIGITVTPNINEQDYITLALKPTVEEITGWTGPNNERPIISTRSAEAKVMIKNEQTLVMGGLISEKKIGSRKGFPFLNKIPVLDLIFGKRDDSVSKTDLLIFITPHIIREGFSPLEETAKK